MKKGVFLVLRESLFTVQATAFVDGDIGRAMVQYAEDISKESVVDVRGEVVITPSPVSGCTQKEIEVKIQEVGFEGVLFSSMKTCRGTGISVYRIA